MISNDKEIINHYKHIENKCGKGKQEGKNTILKRLHRCFGQWLKKEQGKAERKLMLLVWHS